jgi:hypothetical protein
MPDEGKFSARCNPIKGTEKHVKRLPRHVIHYRIPASRWRQVRLYMGGKIIKRSTKTASEQKADKFATALYIDLLQRHDANQPLTRGSRFESVCNDLLAEDAKRLKPRALTDETQAFQRDLIPFFRHYQLDQIKYKTIQQYIENLNKNRDQPLSASSLRTYVGYLHKVLTHAVRNEWLDRLPPFPIIKRQDRPRDWFNPGQRAKLRETIKQEVAKETVVQYQPITTELLEVTYFMIEAYLRPGDLKNLKNKHIEFDPEYKYLRIRLPDSKTIATPIITDEAAIATWKRLKATHKDKAGDEDYLIFPNLTGRAHAMRILQKQFRHILETAKLKTSSTGDERTLYSLRHTCAIEALLEPNADINRLATNMRTSPDMIHRFYAAHLNAEIYARREHDKRKQKHRKRQISIQGSPSRSTVPVLSAQ